MFTKVLRCLPRRNASLCCPKPGFCGFDILVLILIPILNMRKLTNHISCCIAIVLPFIGSANIASGQSLQRYLHKNAFLDSQPNAELHGFHHKPISPRQAAFHAVNYLKSKHASSILVCEVRWIAAPLGGYLVDAKAKAAINGVRYTIFRVGVKDGSEQHNGKNLPGEIFVFIALGKDRSGKLSWHPSPGPDKSWKDGVTNDMLAYEFLCDRERFVTLDDRYR